MKKLEDTSKSHQKHHYVYRITNIIVKKHYYGCRSSYIEPKLDLGTKYFSSSTDKAFIREQKEHKDIFKYKIVKIFSSRKEAEYYETKLHEKFQVQIHESFYNKAKNTLMGFSVEGRKQSEEHKINNKRHIKGKSYEERYGKERAEVMKNNIKLSKENISDETKEKISISKTGVTLSDFHKRSISEGGQIRWDSASKEYIESFKEKMTNVNQNLEKRKDASIKIKQKWKEPEYREKMHNRQPRSKKKILVIQPDEIEFVYEGFEDMIKEFNFNPTMVRRSLKDGLPCTTKIKTTKDSSKNTIGFIFKEINENKEN